MIRISQNYQKSPQNTILIKSLKPKSLILIVVLLISNISFSNIKKIIPPEKPGYTSILNGQFQIIDVNANAPIATFSNNDLVNNTYTWDLNIADDINLIANPSLASGTYTHVRFITPERTHTEGVAPYAYYGDYQGNYGTVPGQTPYYGWSPADNSSLDFTVQYLNNGTVVATDTFTISFVRNTSDTTPPSAPGLNAITSFTDSTADLSWTASSDASGINRYEVIRSGGPIISVGLNTSYQAIGLNPSTTYSFTVRAVDNAGNTSTSVSRSVTTAAAPGGGTSGHNYDSEGVIYSHGSNVVTIGNSIVQGSYGNEIRTLELSGSSGGFISILSNTDPDQELFIGSTQHGNNISFHETKDLSFAAGLESIMTLYGQNTPQGKGVAISTDNLPSGYSLAVGGKIIAEELKVQLQSAWPDYVFKKDYELPTLSQVEKHISEKGHLIIPSAEEVEKNGIEVGEMNRKLLEKIEELTLYVLQLKKENEAQQLEINKLKEGK